MAKAKKPEIGTSKVDTVFGRELIESMKEVLAHRRGQINLASREVHVTPAASAKKIRKAITKPPK